MLKKPLDEMDRKILSILQEEAKLTNVQLAGRVGLSASPCLARVRALEASGAIRQYVTLVDPDAVGLCLNVFIQVTLERQIETALEEFESKMHSYSEVLECYLMTGLSDYLIRLLVQDTEQLQQFIVQKLSTISGVSNIQSSFALKQVKYKTALPGF